MSWRTPGDETLAAPRAANFLAFYQLGLDLSAQTAGAGVAMPIGGKRTLICPRGATLLLDVARPGVT